MTRAIWWRGALLLTGVGILVGGPQHPRGSMAEMLGHPDWVQAHLWVLLGFVALVAALLLHRRQLALPARSARWTRVALWATALQAVEMVLHTAAVVDHAHLVAGHSTPVLSAHLAMSLVAYPVFGLAAAAWIVATARDGSLGSPWVAWLGIAGALAHGAAPPLVVGLGIAQARWLFPMVMAFALWCVLAAVWPVRVAPRAAEPEAAGQRLSAATA